MITTIRTDDSLFLSIAMTHNEAINMRPHSIEPSASEEVVHNHHTIVVAVIWVVYFVLAIDMQNIVIRCVSVMTLATRSQDVVNAPKIRSPNILILQ